MLLRKGYILFTVWRVEVDWKKVYKVAINIVGREKKKSKEDSAILFFG